MGCDYDLVSEHPFEVNSVQQYACAHNVIFKEHSPHVTNDWKWSQILVALSANVKFAVPLVLRPLFSQISQQEALCRRKRVSTKTLKKMLKCYMQQ